MEYTQHGRCSWCQLVERLASLACAGIEAAFEKCAENLPLAVVWVMPTIYFMFRACYLTTFCPRLAGEISPVITPIKNAGDFNPSFNQIYSGQVLTITHLPHLQQKYWCLRPGSAREECRVRIEFLGVYAKNLPVAVQIARKETISAPRTPYWMKSPADQMRFARKRIHYFWVVNFFDLFCHFLDQMKIAVILSYPAQTSGYYPVPLSQFVHEIRLPCRKP